MIEGIDIATSSGSGGLVGGAIAFLHKFLADRKADQRDKDVNDKIDRVEDKIAGHELFAARNYVTQEVLKNALQPVISQLIRMEGKIDNLKETKADKDKI